MRNGTGPENRNLHKNMDTLTERTTSYSKQSGQGLVLHGHDEMSTVVQAPLLLTCFNFDPSMDK